MCSYQMGAHKKLRSFKLGSHVAIALKEVYNIGLLLGYPPDNSPSAAGVLDFSLTGLADQHLNSCTLSPNPASHDNRYSPIYCHYTITEFSSWASVLGG